MINRKMSYRDAKKECEKVTGGQLAEIMDEATADLFYNMHHDARGDNTGKL